MQTKEESFLSWATGAGNLDQEALKTDVERLTAFYYDHGYVNVKVDEPLVERKDDGLNVTIKIDEGEQYKVGTVKLGGDATATTELNVPQLEMKSGDVFRASKLRKDILKLTEATATTATRSSTSSRTPTSTRRRRWSTSPTRSTRARRSTSIASRSPATPRPATRSFAASCSSRSRSGSRRAAQEEPRALQRLGFFQEVNITTQRSDQPDKIDLLVDVKEAQTGAFTAGAGFSSGDQFLFNVRLSENNLFGRASASCSTPTSARSAELLLRLHRAVLLRHVLHDAVHGLQLRPSSTTSPRGHRLLAPGPLSVHRARPAPDPVIGASLDEVRFGLQYRLEDADISNITPGVTIPSVSERRASS